MQSTKSVFISYADEDKDLLEELIIHLRFLKEQHIIDGWYNRSISHEMDWQVEIDTHLDGAHIVLLLISPHFVASSYCRGAEIRRALERQQVIPIILRPCMWQKELFAALQVLPRGAKPITHWDSFDDGFFSVVEGISTAIKQALPDLSQYSVSINPGRLYETLVRLNYREQAEVFRQFKANSRVGAFLIHGEASYGQSWLLNRLVAQLPDSSAVTDFRFSFARKACGRSLEDLWEALARKVGVRKKNPRQPWKLQESEIVRGFYRLSRGQSLVLMLDRLHEIDERYLLQFVCDFWLPLVDEVKRASQTQPTHYLLLFLLDNADCIDTWNLNTAEKLDISWEPHVPIKLQKLSLLSDTALNDWLSSEIDTLPPDLTVQTILEHSEGGIPEFVLDYICSIFGRDWPGLIKYKIGV